MRFSIGAALVAAVSVSAQTTHNIMVGQTGLTYSPSNITAAPGDIVSFMFFAKNHTATQSTFAAPCTQLVNSTGAQTVVGISSGYMPVGANASSQPVWSIQVQDTTPLWFFCLQANHCQQGMVFSINATPQKSFDQYLTAAKATTNSTAAPQTGGAQTPPGSSNGSSASGSSAGAPGVSVGGVVATGTGTTAPNGSPVSGAGSAATTKPSSPATRAMAGSTSLIVSALALAFGIAL